MPSRRRRFELRRARRFAPLKVPAAIASGHEQPAVEHHAFGEPAPLAGQEDEDLLGDILGGRRIAQLAETLRINQVNVGMDQGAKRLRRAAGRVLAKGFVHVLGGYHTP